MAMLNNQRVIVFDFEPWEWSMISVCLYTVAHTTKLFSMCSTAIFSVVVPVVPFNSVKFQVDVEDWKHLDIPPPHAESSQSFSSKGSIPIIFIYFFHSLWQLPSPSFSCPRHVAVAAEECKGITLGVPRHSLFPGGWLNLTALDPGGSWHGTTAPYWAPPGACDNTKATVQPSLMPNSPRNRLGIFRNHWVGWKMHRRKLAFIQFWDGNNNPWVHDSLYLSRGIGKGEKNEIRLIGDKRKAHCVVQRRIYRPDFRMCQPKNGNLNTSSVETCRNNTTCTYTFTTVDWNPASSFQQVSTAVNMFNIM